MSKKLNVASITNELAESAFFRPNTQAVKPEEKLPTNPALSDRATARPDDLPAGKGILVRRGFEWREDQLRALKKLSLKEQLEGKPGSMSQMVRDALDEYLTRRAAEE